MWVLLVVLAVAFAAIAGAFVWATGQEAPPGQTPTVTLTDPPLYGVPGDATVNVTSVSAAVLLRFYRVEVRSLVGSGALIASAVVKVGTLYQNGGSDLTFEDPSGSGKLSVGDSFHLLSFPQSIIYSLTLVYVPTERSLVSVTIVL